MHSNTLEVSLPLENYAFLFASNSFYDIAHSNIHSLYFGNIFWLINSSNIVLFEDAAKADILEYSQNELPLLHAWW